jgi:hypothetical protein
LQFDKFVEVSDGLESALTEAERVADDLRGVLRKHGVCVANAATDVDGHYIHMSVISRACGKMDDVTEKPKNVTNKICNLVHEESPPREVQEEQGVHLQ